METRHLHLSPPNQAIAKQQQQKTLPTAFKDSHITLLECRDNRMSQRSHNRQKEGASSQKQTRTTLTSGLLSQASFDAAAQQVSKHESFSAYRRKYLAYKESPLQRHFANPNQGQADITLAKRHSGKHRSSTHVHCFTSLEPSAQQSSTPNIEYLPECSDVTQYDQDGL